MKEKECDHSWIENKDWDPDADSFNFGLLSHRCRHCGIFRNLQPPNLQTPSLVEKFEEEKMRYRNVVFSSLEKKFNFTVKESISRASETFRASPLELLTEIGVAGRAVFIEILTSTYSEEVLSWLLKQRSGPKEKPKW